MNTISNQLSNIHPHAKIAENVNIAPFVTIYPNVEIDENTWLGPHVTVFDGARIGKNCKIFPGAVISAIPQDLKFQGEETLAVIGDNTTVRECVTVNRGTKEKYKTVVGNNCLLMAYTHIAHDCIIGNNVILANGVNLAGHVEIEDFTILEGLVAVQQFVKIGTHAFVTGGSLVRKNIPPFVKAAREPLAYIGINSVGLRRRGYTNDAILLIEDIYRTLYIRGYNVSNALSVIEQEAPASKDKEQIIKFIKESVNGIIRGNAQM